MAGAWHTAGLAHMTNKRCLALVDFAVADLENKSIILLVARLDVKPRWLAHTTVAANYRRLQVEFAVGHLCDR